MNDHEAHHLGRERECREAAAKATSPHIAAIHNELGDQHREFADVGERAELTVAEDN